MSIVPIRTLVAVIVLLAGVTPVAAQEDRAYLGVIAGFSILSGDGRSVTTADRSSVSLYNPENGPALNIFGGWALGK